MRKANSKENGPRGSQGRDYSKIATLLAAITTMIVLHQIEAGYEQEWALFDAWFDITGFLLLNAIIVALPFLGFYWLIRGDIKGLAVSLFESVGSWVPFLVHIVFVPKAGHFDKPISLFVIIAGAVLGAISLVLSIAAIARATARK